MSMSDYEPSSALSMNSDRSKHSRNFTALTRQLKRSRHSRAFRRIMRKLKNQKRLSRSIEKIFISKKEERPLNETNHDPLLIKPKPEVVTQQVEAPVVQEPAQSAPAKPEPTIVSDVKKNTKNAETEQSGSKANQTPA
jgi:hypothetical protein